MQPRISEGFRLMLGYLQNAVGPRPFRMSALAAGLVAATAAAPAAAVITPSLNDWRWARTGVVNIDVGVNVSAAWRPFIGPVLAGWSRSVWLDLDAVPGRSATSSCNPVFGTIQVCSGNYGASGWLGYANVWVSSGRIVMGNVRLNDFYFATGRYATAAWRQATVCHEIGHTLGLDHNDSSRTNANLGSCLDYTNDPSGKLGTNGKRANTAPGYVDFVGLNQLYAVPDKSQLPQTLGLSVSGAGLMVPEPASWMMLIAGFGLTGAALRRRRAAPA